MTKEKSYNLKKLCHNSDSGFRKPDLLGAFEYLIIGRGLDALHRILIISAPNAPSKSLDQWVPETRTSKYLILTRTHVTPSTTVTGASSGFGKALAEVVLRKGDIVVATLRTPSVLAPLTKQYPPTQLLLLPLDVTRPFDITAAFTRTQEVFGRLDVVFNNAGYAMVGEVEGTPDADARAVFEVNFWGAVGVSRAAVKFFREVNPPGKGGVILQNSSMAGFFGTPGGAFYCAR